MKKGQLFTDETLGVFRATGERRIPLAGEYYRCETIDGVARAVKGNEKAWPRDILIPQNTPERLAVVR